MPVYSMTGFASVPCTFESKALGHFAATLTIKSLNGRFFEANCRIPLQCARIEQPMMQRAKELLRRGSVTIMLQVHTAAVLKGAVVPALATARQYVQALRSLQDDLQVSGTLSVSDLVHIPDLFETIELEGYDELSHYLLARVDDALRDLLVARMREGATLEHELMMIMDAIAQAIDELSPLADRITAERRERFLQEIRSSIEAASAEVQEAHVHALYANVPAIDTREEIVRLRSHHANFLHTLGDAEPQKGKKLEFILQELLREINTLSAKLLDAAAINPILTIKTKLEHAREQVQNIV